MVNLLEELRTPACPELTSSEGEMEIDADGAVETYQAGDFAYLRAGARQTFTVRDRVKHIYVTYPCNWSDG